MSAPSDYELRAWQDIQRFKGRPLSRTVRKVGEQVSFATAKLNERATKYLEDHPRLQTMASGGKEIVSKNARIVGNTARNAFESLPDWTIDALQSARQTVGRASRAGLSAKRVIKLHKKRGHNVTHLADLRHLDLEQIDVVGKRGLNWYYPVGAAVSGAGAGLVITGSQLAIAASAGAAAAPSGGAIAGAVTADAAVVLGLASRSVGQISLLYGYDPEVPAEKLFVMSVVNAGTALSTTAKATAMADISRLTQALVRGKTWKVLNDAVVAKVATQFAKAFGFRLTKNGLGRVVPAAGIMIGGALNWTTLEAIVDAADVAYRRRFLLDKYPYLADEESSDPDLDTDADLPDSDDVTISVLDDLAEAGGPTIH